MNRSTAICILLCAATLEAGGDAMMRVGLHASSTLHRSLFFAGAVVALFAYGYAVNSPPWDFGRLLGLYVVFFFVIAQMISWLVFKEHPSPLTLMGGALIVLGGIVISSAKP